MMTRCSVLSLLVAVMATSMVALPDARAQDAMALLEQARAAYAKRLEGDGSQRAVELFEKSIKAGATFDSLWEGARATAFHGSNKMKAASKRDRAAMFTKGEEWARRAAKMQPNKVQGHFYIAVLIGMRAQSLSIFHQMSVAGEIRERAERSVKLDRNFECAAPLRMLGQYFLRLPGAFGGDNERAFKLLDQASKICPTDLDNRLRLAEALHEIDQDDRARKELRYVLDHPPTDPEEQASFPQQKREAQGFLEDWY